jgi:hypothetical protein
MKKTSTILFSILIAAYMTAGCSKATDSASHSSASYEGSEAQTPSAQAQTMPPATQPETKEPAYNDGNATSAIGLYAVNSATNVREPVVSSFDEPWEKGKDITCFEVLATKTASLPSGNYRSLFNRYWSELPDSENLKIGYELNIKLTSGEILSGTIRTPDDTLIFFDYIEVYLYDDVHQIEGAWYSHVEMKDLKENTLLTSAKLTAGKQLEEVESITFAAFTYAGETDFNAATGKYIGGNKYGIAVNNGK